MIASKEITLVKIKDIKPNPKNRNKHSKEQIERLCQLFEYQGFRDPLIVSNRSGLLVTGHGRLIAAKKLKFKELPVIYQDFENEEHEYAFGISHNAVASWAELDLSSINTDLVDLGPDFDIDLLGIKNFEIEVADKIAQSDEDSVPATSTLHVKTVLGDLYQLGDHRLLCGDSTSIDAIEKLRNDADIEMLFTDPPYGISIVNIGANAAVGFVGANAAVGFVGVKKSPSQKAKARQYKAIEGDDQPFDPNLILGLGFKIIVLWGANHYASRLPNRPQWLIWDKKLESGSLDHNNFSDCELAWTNQTALSAKIYRHTWAGMLREGNRTEELKDRVHPTQKPVGLCEQIINDYDPKSIIDLYGGSGSTLIACEKTNRKCFMMELDPYYCDVIVARWEAYTGRKAELIGGS